MFACNGILFNHESPRRGETFVSRKITRAVSRIGLGQQDVLYLGNLDAKRDWGHAKDYVEAMWLMLQQDQPDDYVIATGVTTTVRDFVVKAFAEIGIQLEFKGQGAEEVGVISSCHNPEYQLEKGIPVVKIDTSYFRPTEVDVLVGDATKCKTKLNWEPKYDLDNLIKDMMHHDLELFKKEAHIRSGGFKASNHIDSK